jgi:hypothetical protein
VANVHLASGRGHQVLADLEQREPDWLLRAARRMERRLERDYAGWRRSPEL